MSDSDKLLFDSPDDLFRAIDDTLADACVADAEPYVRTLLKEVSRVYAMYRQVMSDSPFGLDGAIFMADDLAPVLARYETAASRLRSRLGIS